MAVKHRTRVRIVCECGATLDHWKFTQEYGIQGEGGGRCACAQKHDHGWCIAVAFRCKKCRRERVLITQQIERVHRRKVAAGQHKIQLGVDFQ